MTAFDYDAAFQDFDEAEVYKRMCEKLEQIDSQNFVLDFDEKNAKCAFDLDGSAFKSLLSKRKQQKEAGQHLRTRWINIWQPEKQKETIDTIARHYGFSPRLRSSMSCTHISPVVRSKRDRSHRTIQEVWHGVPRKEDDEVTTATNSEDGDLEKVLSADMETYKPTTLDINHYTVVDEVWHFASVDWGFKFTCIGFNSLYASKEAMNAKQIESDNPAGKRIWTWLVLCNDRTVIAIHENPYPRYKQTEELKDLRSIRHNLGNVFVQLSTAAKPADNPIMTVNIRPGLYSEEGDEVHITEDAVPSLLFYYLFDDWYNNYALVARREHQYGRYLEEIRQSMFQSPDIEHARKLHHFGRQLAVLKRIYQSYNMLIERLLMGPQADKYSTRRNVGTTPSAPKPIPERRSGYGVQLTTAAAVRFERLRDRIELYALSEIQDCLEEKEDLVMLNFNLVALKESSYVERLTRITILLAKITILFLPVSLMSAYFAIPIVGVGDQYTLVDFWAAFAVVFGLSIGILIIFGQLSGTEEGKPIYRSLTRATYEYSRGLIGKPPKRRGVMEVR